MYPYVAFLWSFRNPEAKAAATALASALEGANLGWTLTFVSTGMQVYTRPTRADLREYPLPSSRGVILGRLFPSDPRNLAQGWEPTLTDRDCARYLDSGGRRLAEDYWGAYIAFLTSPEQPHSVVLRDPSGKIPCYRLRHANVDVLFSDIADLAALPLPPLTFNLRYLAALIYLSTLEIRESALTEVTEILAGECLEVHGSSAEQRIGWDPCSVASAARNCPGDLQAAQRLRWITQACIDAWASVHRRVLHCLSGGLDSSIVLGCLARSPSAPAVVCANHYVEDAEGDERAYARIAARHANVPLVECGWSSETFAFDARLLALPKSAKPGFSQCARLIHLEAINREADRYEVDAVWKGQGGDHLFLKAPNIASAADYLADHGLRWGLGRAVRDAARHSMQSYVSVLSSALFSGRANPSRETRRAERKAHFVCPEALPDDLEGYLAHPWTLAAEGLPAGRQRQIQLLAGVVNRHRPMPGMEAAYEHHPLLSQPIVEQCLSIPTYLHLKGGKYRALARAAFGDCVPREILHRESKGATTSLTVESIRRCASFLCELLLDGLLVRERLVERVQLESCLRDGRALAPDQLPPLLACIAVEVWARAWSRTSGAQSPVRPR